MDKKLVTILQPEFLFIFSFVYCFLLATASKSRRASDIISMLVNIYGSKELFVSEYKTLLADRILSTFNFEMAREIRYLELLKLRFGESQLHNCEVMLKDVADSKRINTRIAEERKKSGEAEVNHSRET